MIQQEMAGLDNRVPTSNPLCLVTSGVGGFDYLALSPDSVRHEID